jgi:hypothetical protein
MARPLRCPQVERLKLGESDMMDSNVEVLVAIGRIEEMLKALSDKIDKLEEQTERKFATADVERERLWKKLNSLDTEVQLLRDRQGPKIHWLTVAAIVASVGAVLLTIIERYVN